MKKLLCLIVLLLVLAVPAMAAASHLVDGAGLLTTQEQRQVVGLLDELSSRHGMDIVVVTTDSLEGKSPMAYADDYYDYNGYGADGILLLVSMEDNDWHISTAGRGITVFTDAGIDYMADRFVHYLSDGSFAEAFEEFATLCDEFILQANTGDPYDSHNLPKAPFNTVVSLVVALAAGLITALIVTGRMKKELKTAVPQQRADSYVTPGSLQLTASRDLFLYSHLSRHQRSESSSGSTTHTSSSGTTHGGGGGKF